MKRDPSRVKRILRIRQNQEEAARARWQAAEIKAQEAEQESLDAQDRYLAELQSWRARMLSATPEQALQAQAALDRMVDYQALTASRAARIREAADEARQPWMEARKTVRGMERLFERTESEWRLEQSEREIKEAAQTLEASMARARLESEHASRRLKTRQVRPENPSNENQPPL